MNAGITVAHKDGRIGHLFGVDKIDSKCMYWFRWKKTESTTYVGEFVPGSSLKKVDDDNLQIDFQTTLDF